MKYYVIIANKDNYEFAQVSRGENSEDHKQDTIDSINEMCRWIVKEQPVSFQKLIVFEIDGDTETIEKSIYFDAWLKDNFETIISEKFEERQAEEKAREEERKQYQYKQYLELKAMFEGEP